MGKKNKRPQNTQPKQVTPVAPSQPSQNELAAKLEAAIADNAKVEAEIPDEITLPDMAKDSLSHTDKSEPNDHPKESIGSEPSASDILKLQKAWEKAIEEANRNNERAKKWSEQAKSLEESWLLKSRVLGESERELKSRKESLASEETKLQEEKEKLIKLQAEAEAGFISRRAELLADLEEEIRKYSSRFLEHDRKIQNELKDAEEGLDKKRAEIAEEKSKADAEIQQLRMQVRAEQRKAQWLSEELEQEKNDWQKRVDEQVERRISQYIGEMEELKNTNSQQREEILGLKAEQKAVGNRPAADLVREIETHKKTIDSLNAQLANSLAADERSRLKQLQEENDLLHQQLEQIQQKNTALQTQATKASIGIAELENLRDQRAAWECRELGYRARLDELKSDIEEYTAKVNEKDVFPACSDMDRDDALQKLPVIRRTDEIKLKVFATEIQQLIGSSGLFYRQEDIRSFMGGLAACRLHILQGISGTGKTSLPLAFAKVMQWGSDLCEVQSGWRDRNDLLGYFNTFEKKFYESDFLKALYRASTPAYRHLPFFIVLDEMNLSHPEHYFADFLSALEKRDEEKSVSLPNAPLADSGPAGLIDRGRKMPIPPNVWFIGTANQDETTKDFADKTYDRSHIMEFPRHRAQFDPKLPNIPPGKISFEQLQVAFGTAVKQHARMAEECIRILDGKLRRPLEDMEIGWGNRLEAQLRRYIPVLVACGGDISEGLDSILSRKLLRKLKGRFDLSPDDMVKLRNTISSVWDNETQLKSGIPEHSVGLIETELRRLGGNI
jgi:hypothetical protein